MVLLLFTRSKFSTLHLSSFSFSRSEISYICKFMPNCLHLIIRSCSSKLEGKDPEKTQASFSVFFFSWEPVMPKIAWFQVVIGTCNLIGSWPATETSWCYSCTQSSRTLKLPTEEICWHTILILLFFRIKTYWPQSGLPVNFTPHHATMKDKISSLQSLLRYILYTHLSSQTIAQHKTS